MDGWDFSDTCVYKIPRRALLSASFLPTASNKKRNETKREEAWVVETMLVDPPSDRAGHRTAPQRFCRHGWSRFRPYLLAGNAGRSDQYYLFWDILANCRASRERHDRSG